MRLCSDLREFIKTGQAKKTYLSETEEFLDHIKKSLDAIEVFAKEGISSKIDGELIESKLRDFAQIKTALSWLYILTKEAIAADSLSIPFSLAMFINKMARDLPSSPKASLVVLSSSNLMYYKWDLKPLRDLTNRLAKRVKGYPVLSKDIGILMFPYCAAKDVLVNCDLFHEMGHYIYETTGIEDELIRYIGERYVKFVKDKKLLDKLHAPLIETKALLNFVLTLLLRWSDEVFADIFAIRTVGPAFHLAYRELQQMTAIPLDESAAEKEVSNVETPKRTFSETHPADAFRFKIHWKWLKSDGWDKVLEKQIPEVAQDLMKCENFKTTDFKVASRLPVESVKNKKINDKEIHDWMLEEFTKIVDQVEKAVSQSVEKLEKPLDDFKRNRKLVIECLEHGVVPSTVYDDELGRTLHPYPITVLNYGFFFYLRKMDKLLERVRSKDSPIDKRIKYERRLNEWLAKAIEDWQILDREGKL